MLCLFLAACNPTPIATPQGTATSTLVPSTPTPSPTPIPVAYVGGSVPCYSGPDKSEIVVTLEITDDIQILGKDETGEFWIVTKAGRDEQCWLESRFVTAEGELASLPVLAPTATPILPIPSTPQNFSGESTCKDEGVYNAAYAILTWDDVEYESGYKIYRVDELIAELGPNETSFIAIIEYFSHSQNSGGTTFVIRAFNDAGSSEGAEINVSYSCRV